MRRQLLLAATLGALAILPAPASAHGHGPVHSNVVSSFGVRIVVRDGPTVVHHHQPRRGHLRPQPWPRQFKHHAPRPRFHQPRHRQTRHFQFRDWDRRQWFRGPGPQRFKHGRPTRWQHAPWHRSRPAVRNHFPHARFKHGHPGSGPRRHR